MHQQRQKEEKEGNNKVRGVGRPPLTLGPWLCVCVFDDRLVRGSTVKIWFGKNFVQNAKGWPHGVFVLALQCQMIDGKKKKNEMQHQPTCFFFAINFNTALCLVVILTLISGAICFCLLVVHHRSSSRVNEILRFFLLLLF